MGGTTFAWQTYATRWARIDTMSGGESPVGAGVASETTHTVTMRYDSSLSVTVPRDRVLFGSRVLDVVTVNRIEQRPIQIVLTCQERR
ncbi:MAG: hypothetical protein JETCAE02_27110 [Anaerolineaceae bacterium]|nr:MAG: hypothetical protein JETCAE02_27110 [Anaerolineaceae bacterium]